MVYMMIVGVIIEFTVARVYYPSYELIGWRLVKKKSMNKKENSLNQSNNIISINLSSIRSGERGRSRATANKYLWVRVPPNIKLQSLQFNWIIADRLHFLNEGSFPPYRLGIWMEWIGNSEKMTVIEVLSRYLNTITN